MEKELKEVVQKLNKAYSPLWNLWIDNCYGQGDDKVRDTLSDMIDDLGEAIVQVNRLVRKLNPQLSMFDEQNEESIKYENE